MKHVVAEIFDFSWIEIIVSFSNDNIFRNRQLIKQLIILRLKELNRI